MGRHRPPAPWSWLAIASLALAPVAAGCTGAGERSIEIAMRYSRFEPSTLTVRVGQNVRFTLRNEDFIDHEWIVGDDALHARHETGDEPAHGDRPTEQSIPALGVVTTTVRFPEPGTYAYICHLPGHRVYGMVGTLVVTGG